MTSMTEETPTTRSGFVALAGIPNAGKSTLMNAILGQKISIATSKPQTTRNRILGVHTVDEGQVIFVDTPGIHSSHKALNTVMVENAIRSIGATDIVLFVVDANIALTKDGQSIHPQHRFVAERIAAKGVDTIIAVNKIDRLPSREHLLPIFHAYSSLPDLKVLTCVGISALEKDGLDQLLNVLFEHLPEGPPLYPEDMITDQAERFIAAEIIREALMLQTRREIPYSTAVIIDEFRDEPRRNLLRMRASIHVERKSQKGIVIGRQGSRLKQIGSQARSELERFFDRKVYLDIHVTVSKNWTESRNMMRKLGYDDEDY